MRDYRGLSAENGVFWTVLTNGSNMSRFSKSILPQKEDDKPFWLVLTIYKAVKTLIYASCIIIAVSDINLTPPKSIGYPPKLGHFL